MDQSQLIGLAIKIGYKNNLEVSRNPIEYYEGYTKDTKGYKNYSNILSSSLQISFKIFSVVPVDIKLT